MIQKEIAMLIYNCYNEIEQGDKMIEELKNRLNEKGELKLEDGWGNITKTLELRIPLKNHGSYQIKNVPFKLALDVIQEHKKAQEVELERLKEVCRVQLAS